MGKLRSGSIVFSPVSGNRYRIAEILGQGGFGCAYRTHRLDSRDRRIEEACLKTTTDAESWHREAYFGELLKKSDRAIRMHESFPLFQDSKRRHLVLYCLVFELVESGTVHEHLESTRRPWSQKRAVGEIIALLKLLDQLHGTGALHRDITPMNVFLCKNRRLKLGDFGIARHVLAGQAATASVFNPGFVSTRMALGMQRHWLASDDVYQMGQLLGMLLRGDPQMICERDVERLPCDESLKQIICKALCHRKSRFSDAREMLRALQGDVDPTAPRLESLAGKTVVFTGPLTIRRFDAELLVKQCNGSVSDQVTTQVDVVVQGRRSPHYRNGHKGDKLGQAETLIRQGHPLCIINEREFRELVGL